MKSLRVTGTELPASAVAATAVGDVVGAGVLVAVDAGEPPQAARASAATTATGNALRITGFKFSWNGGDPGEAPGSPRTDGVC